MADIKRLNYFNYQFLVENDFSDEQTYHLGMRRRHNIVLHSWGIADGLAVSKTGDKEVTISPGLAIDNTGREIVLLDPVTVDLTSFGPNANVHLTIAYQEILHEDDHYTSGGVDNYTRTTERPKIEGKTTVPPGDGSVINLALVKLDGSGNVSSIDTIVRKPVGSKIAPATVGPTELAKNAVTGEKIANNAVTSGKIANGTVTTVDLAARAVTEQKLSNDAVSTRTLQASAVNDDKIAINAVTSAKLREADGTTGQNANSGSGVKTAHLQNGAVSEVKVAGNAITSSKIKEADGSSGQNPNTGSGIKTAHLQNLAVSLSKLDSPLQTTVSKAVQNTGGTINGNFNVNGRLISNSTVAGSATAYGITSTGNTTGSGTVYAAYTSAGGSGSGPKYGIRSTASAATGHKYAGYFYANTSGTGSEQTNGVYGQGNSSGSGTVYGVRGYAGGSGSGTKYAVYGSTSGSGTRYAGYFAGRVHISGPLTKPSGSFLIDHVLDPKNKTLRHSFVESPEDLCLYRGQVKLNAKGEATVKMPDYFSALTKEEDATVTLTPIGRKPFLAGYEWNKKHTSFTIYGEPARQVTYIVLADRDDPAIRHFRQPVEEAKGKGNFEKGKFIYPEAYGEPPEVELESEALELEHPDKEVTAVDEAQKRMEDELASEEKQHAKILRQLDLEEKKRLKTLGVLDKKIEPVNPPQGKTSKAGKKKTQKSKKK